MRVCVRTSMLSQRVGPTLGHSGRAYGARRNGGSVHSRSGRTQGQPHRYCHRPAAKGACGLVSFFRRTPSKASRCSCVRACVRAV
jgi:hypothetical protein